MTERWHEQDNSEVLAALKSDLVHGLQDGEVRRRQQQYGRNELTQKRARTPWRILWEQFASTMILVLLVAAVISLVLKDVKDAVAIFAILIFNAALGFLQDYKAEKAMAALQKLAVPLVRVRRNGTVQDIPAPELVPGDIVSLEAGVIVPADCRILESAALQIQEAALTGESVPVEKVSAKLDEPEAPLGDRRNMAYLGTIVTYGRGIGVATATGMATELGHIADLIQSVKAEQTPLQQRLNQLGKRLALIALAIVAVISVLELSRGTETKLVLLTAISMAVAAVPEGLPAVVTIALALGAQRMLRQRALIRKLPAVETLGSVTVICSDKTGTLTQNQMTVTVINITGLDVNLSKGEEVPPAGVFLLACGALCNDASVSDSSEATPDNVIGDPTEAALVVAANRLLLTKRVLDQIFSRVSEVPFSSERKLMTTVHRVDRALLADVSLRVKREFFTSPFVAVTKGAVDRVVSLCDFILADEKTESLSDELKTEISNSQSELARNGMRVLGIAYRPLDQFDSTQSVEASMTFVGLVAMIDPPRPEAKEAVYICKQSGIRPIMITGDHPLTALSIAKDLGISTNNSVLTGQQIDGLTPEELRSSVSDVSVFARVSPEHKLSIVVAMTGDGVNDAPALKKANIGVAMGKAGTDVAKESGDMVLLDDNFATIVSAVKEGRVIYQNIRKFIKYLMTTNYAEVFVMLLAPLVGMPLPLLPLQILWLNLVTDGPPALALGVEPAEADVMKHPARNPKESVFAGGIGMHVAWVGSLMGAVSLGIGYFYWTTQSENWQTMVFLTLTLCQLAHVLAIRSGSVSFVHGGMLSNPYMIWAVLSTFILQLGVIYIPVLQGVFGTVALPYEDFAVSVIGAASIFVAVEFEKLITRRRSQKFASDRLGKESFLRDMTG
jgi:P-type Ca2+ transporter type 2C